MGVWNLSKLEQWMRMGTQVGLAGLLFGGATKQAAAQSPDPERPRPTSGWPTPRQALLGVFEGDRYLSAPSSHPFMVRGTGGLVPWWMHQSDVPVRWVPAAQPPQPQVPPTSTDSVVVAPPPADSAPVQPVPPAMPTPVPADTVTHTNPEVPVEQPTPPVVVTPKPPVSTPKPTPTPSPKPVPPPINSMPGTGSPALPPGPVIPPAPVVTPDSVVVPPVAVDSVIGRDSVTASTGEIPVPAKRTSGMVLLDVINDILALVPFSDTRALAAADIAHALGLTDADSTRFAGVFHDGIATRLPNGKGTFIIRLNDEFKFKPPEAGKTLILGKKRDNQQAYHEVRGTVEAGKITFELGANVQAFTTPRIRWMGEHVSDGARGIKVEAGIVDGFFKF
jgi:hypothetical protein